MGKINSLYNDPENGKRCFSTRVENNYYPDTGEISNDVIIGRKLIEIKYIGSIIKVLQSKVVSAISIVILCWIYYFNKYKYKAERKRKIKKKYKETE